MANREAAAWQGGGGEGGGGGGGHGGPPTKASLEAAVVNEMLSDYLLLVLGCISAVLLAWRLTTLLVRHVRTVTCLYNDTQRYFAQTSGKYAWFKRNIQYA